jgi:hypothetical protein
MGFVEGDENFYTLIKMKGRGIEGDRVRGICKS